MKLTQNTKAFLPVNNKFVSAKASAIASGNRLFGLQVIKSVVSFRWLDEFLRDSLALQIDNRCFLSVDGFTGFLSCPAVLRSGSRALLDP